MTSDGATDVLAITAEPPGPDLVRTGLVAIFDVSELTDISVAAFDAADNADHLFPVTIRLSANVVNCRNGR